MKVDYDEMVNLYIEDEKLRIYCELNIQKRRLLDNFALFMDKTKGDDWDINDITKDDIERYYMEAYNNMDIRADNTVQEVNHFMRFIFGQGWVNNYS